MARCTAAVAARAWARLPLAAPLVPFSPLPTIHSPSAHPPSLQALGTTQAVGGFQLGSGIMKRAVFGVPGRHQNDFAGVGAALGPWGAGLGMEERGIRWTGSKARVLATDHPPPSPLPGSTTQQNMVQMATVKKANDAVASAAHDAQEASAVLGAAMPHIDARALGAAKMGVFQNMLGGGMGSDMVEVRAAAVP